MLGYLNESACRESPRKSSLSEWAKSIRNAIVSLLLLSPLPCLASDTSHKPNYAPEPVRTISHELMDQFILEVISDPRFALSGVEEIVSEAALRAAKSILGQKKLTPRKTRSGDSNQTIPNQAKPGALAL